MIGFQPLVYASTAAQSRAVGCISLGWYNSSTPLITQPPAVTSICGCRHRPIGATGLHGHMASGQWAEWNQHLVNQGWQRATCVSYEVNSLYEESVRKFMNRPGWQVLCAKLKLHLWECRWVLVKWYLATRKGKHTYYTFHYCLLAAGLEISVFIKNVRSLWENVWTCKSADGSPLKKEAIIQLFLLVLIRKGWAFYPMVATFSWRRASCFGPLCPIGGSAHILPEPKWVCSCSGSVLP